MKNNIVQFPDKKKDFKEDLDNITNELITDIIDIHGAVGCVTILIKEKDSTSYEYEAYAGGNKDIFPLLSMCVEKGLKQIDNVGIK